MIRTSRLLPLLAMALVPLVAAPAVALQNVPDKTIVRKSDGSLFFIQNGMRYMVNAASLTDEEIDAIPLAPVSGDLFVTRGAPVSNVERNVIEPSDTFGLDLSRPIPGGTVCLCSVDRRGRVSSFEIRSEEHTSELQS